MKSISTTATIFSLLLFIVATTVCVHAGTVEEIKEESKKAARDIRQGAVETGKEIKEGTQRAWKEVKEGVKEAGKDFKKAYEDTRDAVRKEISGGRSQTEASEKDTDQK